MNEDQSPFFFGNGPAREQSREDMAARAAVGRQPLGWAFCCEDCHDARRAHRARSRDRRRK